MPDVETESIRIISDVHVCPPDEGHVESRYCWCGPRLHWEDIVVVVIHRTADGHEFFEGLTLQ